MGLEGVRQDGLPLKDHYEWTAILDCEVFHMLTCFARTSALNRYVKFSPFSTLAKSHIRSDASLEAHLLALGYQCVSRLVGG